MGYLFFDIECSEGKSMCSFGYVLTDEHFNVLKKEDILMNPEAIFHTGAWGKKNRIAQPGIEMAYPKEVFLKSPTFPTYYDKIKKLIELPGQKVIGFSHKNDTVFLDNACKRYNLPSIDYTFYDVQIIHKESNGFRDPVSTEKISEELGLDVTEYVAHKSDDDAAVSMLVTAGFCKTESISLDELILKYPNCEGRHFAYKTVYKYKTRAESLIRVINRDSTSGNNTMRGNNFSKYKTFTEDIAVDKFVKKTLSGIKVAVSHSFLEGHFREMLLIYQGVVDRGGKITTHPSEADIFVDFGESDDRRAVEHAAKRGREIKVIPVKELYELIGTTEREIAKTASAK